MRDDNIVLADSICLVLEEEAGESDNTDRDKELTDR